MTTKIQRWGNSLALRIPKAFVKDAHLERGGEVNISISHGRLVVEASPKKKYSLSGLLANISKDNLHGEVRTGKSMGKEIW